VTELTYPAFPRKALAALGAALVALCAIAMVVNRSGPDERGCAVAAAHVMTARNYSIAAMKRIGADRVPHCRGLTAGQFGQAVASAYAIEFGRRLPDASNSRDMPPASFRARSARAASLAR
jgi:sugar phosphate isomerase/epimerase